MNNTMTNGLGIVAKSGDHQGHPTSLYGASWRIPALCILCQTASRCWKFWLDKPHGKWMRACLAGFWQNWTAAGHVQWSGRSTYTTLVQSLKIHSYIWNIFHIPAFYEFRDIFF